MPLARIVGTLCLLASQLASAQSLDQRVLPREVADEVVLLFNAAETQRIEGRYEIESGREVRRDLAVLGGPLVIAGKVTGRIVAVNATVEFVAGGELEGDILIVGGQVIGRDLGHVTGTIRTYSARLSYARDGERLVRRERDSDGASWWRERTRRGYSGWGDLKLVSARTYNRVEGLPIQGGPVFGREFDWGRMSVDALGLLRSADSFAWTGENRGHSAKAELQIGRGAGVRLGARHVDVVEAVEPWQLSDTEVGIASFFLHRDYRDYYNKHGGTVFGGVFVSAFDVSASYSNQKWGARGTRDPWTLFRDTDSWRANPQMDNGKFHIVNAIARFDTRSDERNPRSGWHVIADYEWATGTIAQYGPTSGGVRLPTEGGATRYDRLFVDLRRYNRIAPNAQLNVRLVAGGWLSGDDLPLQRRFSLGGPGTLPGYDFRRLTGRNDPSTIDYLTCGDYSVERAPPPVGTPGECERMALAQVEFRGDLDLDPFGILHEDREWRRRGWGRGAKWVVFADAGRGWLVGPNDGRRFFGSTSIPKLSSFQTDIGAGLLLDDLGLYVAKSLSRSGAPVNFFIRLRPRF